MQKVVSAEPRAKQIVNDILLDMETKPRLMDGRGNAMLVGGEHLPGLQVLRAVLPGRLQGQVRHRHQLRAARERHLQGGLRRRARPRSCASTTSTARCSPTTSTSRADKAMGKVEQFEKEVKEQFVDEPGQMRLLIVVDKLLTGFDAPPATYLYIDKKMRDHGLFQAICRVNRLDGDDKDYGYIVDYRDLFNSLESAITDYTSRRARRLREEGHRGPAHRPHRARRARTSTRRWSGSARSASRSRRRRTRCSTSSTSARSSRATPSSSRPTSRSASSCTRPSPP